jgi:multimeric flavodoxin WrbA
MKRLLIVFHSRSGATARMADAIFRGAQSCEEISVICKGAFDANADDLRSADGLIIATPENFGYMAGAIKDFFDRTFYDCEGKVDGRPYAVAVCAGNDGSGALFNVERILTGLAMKRAAEPIIVRRELTDEDLARCEELGAGIANGLALGIF